MKRSPPAPHTLLGSPAPALTQGVRPLTAATYLALVAMFGIGISSLPDLAYQGLGLALGVAFGVAYALGSRAVRQGRSLTTYFVVQTLVVTAATLLPARVYDAFSFPFYLMSFQGWLVFAPHVIVRWMLLFFGISSLKVFAERGPEGAVGVAFNAVAFVLMAILGYTTRRSEVARRENERLLDELRVAQRQLEEFAVAEERNRLARELHDSVKQQVFAVMMQLGAARVLLGSAPHPARQPVEEAERLAQQAGAELSLLIHELRPTALAERGLAVVLAELLATWARQNEISGALHTEGAGRPPPAIEYALLRVAQEALANVARHSQARTATLQLRTSEGAARLSVTDDGQGFATAAASHGVGLSSMRERMAALGGSLQIISRPGAGTTVTADWEQGDD